MSKSVALHPRNRHQGHYDFAALIAQSPSLGRYVLRVSSGQASIDFSDPLAVRELNAALLRTQYGILGWSIPEGSLCPPVPGRADYIHHLADLLAQDNAGVIPRGAAVRVLDIGVGASCIYPLIGTVEYGWQFVGSDIDARAIASAQRVLDANPHLAATIELRHQAQPRNIFAGVLAPQERFDLSVCNPPFHASAAEAQRGSQRKWRNLGKARAGSGPAVLRNFGGQSNELWCRGGEAGFIRRMIAESAQVADQVRWFSTLVARSEHLPGLHRQLRKAGACEVREVAMAQGNKQSRFLAWRFQDGLRKDPPEKT